ncbi:MAG: radical SAM protein [Nitrospinae bacterium]|nr:radical SAM protein [Nitrospinota bacterium]
MLDVCEIFHSLQGETTRAGFPTVFVRLAGCNLACKYCDTKYAWEPGEKMSVSDVLERVRKYNCNRVELTGGEPMAQAEAYELCQKLVELGFSVMVETNGTFDVSTLPPAVVKIVDIKCPSSGESGKFLWSNLKYLSSNDELKFVLTTREDFDWALSLIDEKNLSSVCTVNISPASHSIDGQEVARWILESGRGVRLNLQLHKIIWGDKRGV